ncbi:hypothetical protein [Pantoea sp. At-9b]|uniref:hypothetical protein n=1 Tax=Pantoea sp. (strain At-9b) TaxID=592316 RepID=UPI0001B3F1CD|nr:hypothetical protein [Pantoea sp. At-9b]ADU69419.1 hypothetical protein Pat9b_2107 [Pantoea sp. At-9b]
MAYFRQYNSAGKLLFDASAPAYMCIEKATVTLNAPVSNYYSGLAAYYTVSFTVKTAYPPMIFVRSETASTNHYRAACCISSLSVSGNTYTFTIWGEGTSNLNSQQVTYYIFACPSDDTSARVGVMALWNESGIKTFDSDYKYLLISQFYSSQNSTLPANVTGSLSSGRSYAFCNTQLSGFDDFGGSNSTTIAAVDRFQFWQDSATSFIYGLGVLSDALSNKPAGSFQNFNLSFILADVTSI